MYFVIFNNTQNDILQVRHLDILQSHETIDIYIKKIYNPIGTYIAEEYNIYANNY